MNASPSPSNPVSIADVLGKSYITASVDIRTSSDGPSEPYTIEEVFSDGLKLKSGGNLFIMPYSAINRIHLK